MGTFFDFTLYGQDGASVQCVMADASKELRRLENNLSRYIADSQISRINDKAGSIEETLVSGDVFEVLRYGKAFGRCSGGVLDITCGHRTRSRLAQAEKQRGISQGYRYIQLNKHTLGVCLPHGSLSLDLGAIGKGYALDCLRQIFRKNDVSRYTINAGGQILNIGQRAPVRIRDPKTGESFKTSVFLQDASVATSAQSYWADSWSEQSHSAGHIMDLSRNQSATSSEFVSVSVVHPQAIFSDALSTALYLLPKDKGLILAKRCRAKQVIYMNHGDGTKSGKIQVYNTGESLC